MLTSAIHRFVRSLCVSDDRGTTLIELMVAMMAGLIVIGALFAILEVSLRQSTNLVDKVQADQMGRIAMTKIVDELHSACIAPSFTPIQTGSGPNELIFISSYSSAAEITSAEEHKIAFNSSAQTLTDNIYKSEGGSWPNFTYPSKATSSVLLANNVTTVKKAKEKIFTYYKYAEKAEETSATPLTTLTGVGLNETLNKEEAAIAASVQVEFIQATPDGNSSSVKRSVNLSSQVTFSFSVPNSETPILDAPCQ
jgi:Tfp pilus assembly protein PilW